MLKSRSFYGLSAGAKLLVVGGVHGNEKCGTKAASYFQRMLESEKLHIAQGCVTFVPNANPQAGRANERFIDRNLNRDFREYVAPASYEDKCANVLCGLIRSHDYVIDLHSYSSAFSEKMDPDFILMGCNPIGETSYQKRQFDLELEFAKNLGPKTIISNWTTARAKVGNKYSDGVSNLVIESPSESVGVAEYARFSGKIAVTVECGQNNQGSTDETAQNVILNALNYLGFIEKSHGNELPKNHNILAFFDGFIKEDQEDVLLSDYKNFDEVVLDETLVLRRGGIIEVASTNGYLIMPAPDCKVGAEMIYLARAVQY